VAAPVRTRHFAVDANVRRRPDHSGTRVAAPRPHDVGRTQFKPVKKPVRRVSVLREKLERHLFQTSTALFVVGAIGWCLLIYNEFRSPPSVGLGGTVYAVTTAGKADSDFGKSSSFGTSIFARSEFPQVALTPSSSLSDTESPSNIVAREWSRFESLRVADRGRNGAKQSARAPSMKPPVRLASLESAPPQVAPFHAPTEAVPSHIRPNIGAETALVDFETAPFPYHGMSGSERPFLNAGEPGNRGHVSFRGHLYWESQTFSDDRVLLHIPPGFDPTRPAVMVVFFHGHGAILARDVRDRQQLPAQITASGANAVLVAPQFAVDAADSSAGKFWEPNGFKRFLDEAAVKLARLYGDPRRAFAFANMPIVIVAYSGGFGPTLSVLDRGGVRSRVRGLVLLDALYGGFDTFADWIANNRSTFFVSSYTPHTAGHNAYLEHLLSQRSVSYGSELRRNNLSGMVTFLPAGDVSHRDFVTHAWADNPIKDILLRMDDVDQKIQTAGATASIPAATTRN
jgi:hypothetical protein